MREAVARSTRREPHVRTTTVVPSNHIRRRAPDSTSSNNGTATTAATTSPVTWPPMSPATPPNAAASSATAISPDVVRFRRAVRSSPERGIRSGSLGEVPEVGSCSLISAPSMPSLVVAAVR